MLAPLQAERQLAEIEATMVGRALGLKPDEAKRVMARHTKALEVRQERSRGGMASQLYEAFQEAGFQIKHEPAKPS